MTPSEQREAFNELAKQPGILTGTQYAELIGTRVCWIDDAEEGIIKRLDHYAATIHWEESGIQVYSRYCGAFENIDAISRPCI